MNVQIAEPLDLDSHPAIRRAIRAAESELSGRGRVVLRISGTEMVVRVMVEGEDAGHVANLAEQLAQSVRTAGGLPLVAVN